MEVIPLRQNTLLISLKIKMIFGTAIITFHENPYSENRGVAFGRTDRTKLIATFRNYFAKAPESYS
jgi:hypothetical protein